VPEPFTEAFLIIKPTRCTNFSNLFLESNSTCFGEFLCPSSGVFHCTHSNGICHTVYADIFPASCRQTRAYYRLYSDKTPNDRQRNCPKHVQFHSKNKFDKLALLVGFIIGIHHDARSRDRPTITEGNDERSYVFAHLYFFVVCRDNFRIAYKICECLLSRFQ